MKLAEVGIKSIFLLISCEHHCALKSREFPHQLTDKYLLYKEDYIVEVSEWLSSSLLHYQSEC